MTTLYCRMKSYIQPFERKLALEELTYVCGATPLHLGLLAETSVEFSVRSNLKLSEVAKKVAYWEVIEYGDTHLITTQSLRESTVNLVRNGIDIRELPKLLPFNGTVPLPNRRCLRYGSHGIHEYRGKFFPQLVRSLINIAGVKPHGIVADPMSGSGTTLVETLLSGHQGLGIDMNPLSVFLGKTKCDLLAVSPKLLADCYLNVRTRLLSHEKTDKTALDYFSRLSEHNRRYLQGWFSTDVLQGLDEIATIIEKVEAEAVRNLMWVSLSNIIRNVSWQKNDDLRVRKEVRLDVELDPKREFLEELGRSVRAVLAFIYQNGSQSGDYSLVEGDARQCANLWSSYVGNVDLVITSPPYATALPYLDTDRLSLCYLGLLSRDKHRSRDQEMIGNREVTDKIRRDYWSKFESDGNCLPEMVRNLIGRIDDLNSRADVGFRRKNLSALLAKYFFDMQNVLMGIYKVLKPGGLAFVVVGNNHTIAGGHRVEIRTASYLSEIATMTGFDVSESMSMDMLVSRDIFKRNALASEEILAFRKPF